MTKLRCSAVHCEYNNEQYCCRPDIQVGGGDDAKRMDQTCCDSFRERVGNTKNAASTYSHPDPSLQIACSAGRCRYNCMGLCKANAVQIGGTTAHKSCDTMCNTFSCEDKKHC